MGPGKMRTNSPMEVIKPRYRIFKTPHCRIIDITLKIDRKDLHDFTTMT